MVAVTFRALAIGVAVLSWSAGGAPAQDAASGGFVDPVPIVRIGPPAGFEYAFTDGRLNPNRGVRTARGNAQSAQIWTNTVPRREIPLSRAAIEAAASANAGAHPTRGSYVQVASFRHLSNAQTAAAQVRSAGLPSRVVTSGAYQVVLAGPLGTASERQSALQTTHALGYGDAFLR